VPGERRSEEEIRLEIAAERDQLAEALTELRGGIEQKRRLAGLVGVVLAVMAAVTVARQLMRA
jgi:hypothetical protein